MRNKLFQDIEEKASRYGKPDIPFVIGIEAIDVSDETLERGALYGMPSIKLLRDSEGNVVNSNESNTYDGIFYSAQNGGLQYEHVSAVVFYQYVRGASHHEHILRIYHNPYASNPLDISIFDGNPQYIPVPDGTAKGHMEWNSPIKEC